MVTTLIKGVTKFRRGYFRKNRDRFLELVKNGQAPSTLFITCADSRVLPHLITDADPGDLFIVRNVGNMVPPHESGQECANIGAAIEYGVSVLNVSEIVVCGHSHCGACAALYAHHHDARELQLTRKWLEQGRKVRDLVLEKSAVDYAAARPIFRSRDEREQIFRATEKAMVVQHLCNLLTYPAVARRVEEGSLTLHGWYYTIETGEVEYYDPEKFAFLPVGRAQAPQLGRLAS